MHFLEIKQAPKVRGLVLKSVGRGFGFACDRSRFKSHCDELVAIALSLEVQLHHASSIVH